jgi:hypothetical protein
VVGVVQPFDGKAPGRRDTSLPYTHHSCDSAGWGVPAVDGDADIYPWFDLIACHNSVRDIA